MKLIWPDHSQLFQMSGNVKLERHRNLYIQSDNTDESFWFALGLNQYVHDESFNENDILFIYGKFARGVFLELEDKNGSHGHRHYFQDGYTSVGIPLENLFDGERNCIRLVKLAGKTTETLKLEYLAIGSEPCYKPTSIFCVTQPSWERGIWRNQEKEVCSQREVYFDHQLNRIEQGDTLYMRPVDQEVTLDQYVRLKTLQDSLPDCKIINSIETLYNYKLKDVTFDIWSSNEIPIPEYQIISSQKQLEHFLETHDRSIVRLNSSCSGKDTHVMSKDSKIEKVYFELVKAYQSNFELGHCNSRIIATNKIAPIGDYHVTARCYVVHGHIFSTYAYVHRMHTDNNLTGGLANTDKYKEDFVSYNEKVLEWSKTYKDLITKSVKCLGLDAACVEYIVTDDGPVFLECNAFWGSGVRRGSWPHTKYLIQYLEDNKDDLIDRIPNVYYRMDENKYWNTFYNLL